MASNPESGLMNLAVTDAQQRPGFQSRKTGKGKVLRHCFSFVPVLKARPLLRIRYGLIPNLFHGLLPSRLSSPILIPSRHLLAPPENGAKPIGTTHA